MGTLTECSTDCDWVWYDMAVMLTVYVRSGFIFGLWSTNWWPLVNFNKKFRSLYHPTPLVIPHCYPDFAFIYIQYVTAVLYLRPFESKKRRGSRQSQVNNKAMNIWSRLWFERNIFMVLVLSWIWEHMHWVLVLTWINYQFMFLH